MQSTVSSQPPRHFCTHFRLFCSPPPRESQVSGYSWRSQLSPTTLDHDQFSCNFQLVPTKFCNAHLMQHYNYHQIRWILTENWLRINISLLLGCPLITRAIAWHFPTACLLLPNSTWAALWHHRQVWPPPLWPSMAPPTRSPGLGATNAILG